MAVDNVFIDANFVCHRMSHAIGAIKVGKNRVEVLVGALREASTLIQRYEPRSIVWCFDSRHSHRKKILPSYKENRIQSDDEAKGALIHQINALRKKQLKQFGFRNVWVESGYEADDLIAVLCKQLHFAETAVIVTGDSDLKQCLRPNIRLFNPTYKTEETAEGFTARNKLGPVMLGHVKAVMGCNSDCVPGVPGVGEVSAWKWVRGELQPHSSKYRVIMENLELIERNMKLVVLPFPGLENRPYKVRKDHLTRGQWRGGLDKFGLSHIPFPG
jgi:5'-3' exonuclease